MLLHRYILGALLRVIILAASVLTAVIAFGAAIKPLAQDLLGPVQLIQYITMATVPMLQFSLPLAAGFGATIVMHRFAADNEILAMSAAGLSYRSVLAPVFLLATILFVIMLALVHFVIPRFMQGLEEIIARDFVTRMFVSAVNDGRAIHVPGRKGESFDIYADEVQVVEGPLDTGADTRLLLAGVAAVQSMESRPVVEFTAEFAVVDVHRLDAGTFLKPALVNAAVYRADEGTFAALPEAEPEAVAIPVRFGNRLNFRTLPEILDPDPWIDEHLPVAERRALLIATLDEADAWRAVERATHVGPIRLHGGFAGRSYVIESAQLEGIRLLPVRSDRLRVVEYESGIPQREALAPAAHLEWTPSVSGDSGSFSLALIDPEVRGLRDGVPRAGRWPQRIGPLRLEGWAPESYASLGWRELAGRGEALDMGGVGRAEWLATQGDVGATALRRAVYETERSLRARLYRRYAMCVSAFLVLALGGVLAVWLHRSVPLAVYIVSFLPAVASTLLISGGEDLIEDGQPVLGQLVLWSGCAALFVMLIYAWGRMSRN